MCSSTITAVAWGLARWKCTSQRLDCCWTKLLIIEARAGEAPALTRSNSGSGYAQKMLRSGKLPSGVVTFHPMAAR